MQGVCSEGRGMQGVCSEGRGMQGVCSEGRGMQRDKGLVSGARLLCNHQRRLCNSLGGQTVT